jgi:hypothetical protein
MLGKVCLRDLGWTEKEELPKSWSRRTLGRASQSDLGASNHLERGGIKNGGKLGLCRPNGFYKQESTLL